LADRSVFPKSIRTQVKGIADTGLLVAFANRRDRHHPWAVELASQVTEPLLTCEAVLAEAAFHLRDAALVLEFVRDGLVRPALDLTAQLPRLRELAARCAGREPDLADLCLIRLSELHPRHPVITTDVGDFRVYRSRRREVIPLISPP
jgi:predicted nucleic acid-binding protein